MNEPNPFRFYTRSHLVLLLGRRAHDLTELLDGIREVPPASIYYHTHRFLQQHHYLSPEPPNDFAYWVTSVLNLDILGESLASVDIVSCRRIHDLRQLFIDELDRYIRSGQHVATSPPGEEFHFLSCKTFVMPTHYEAHTLREFADALGKVTVDSLYFHVFEAPLRLKENDNDFSLWFRAMGKPQIAEEIAHFDPYTVTLERLRQRLIATVNKYA